MLRKSTFIVLTAVTVSLLSAQGAAAGPISPQNPYRSFNITGVNYGSMRWEQTHRGQASAAHRGWTPRRGGLFFRRR